MRVTKHPTGRSEPVPLITEVAKRLHGVAPKLASALPAQCPRCEWPLASRIDLTLITCVNPRCPAKIEESAYHAVQGIGATTVSPDDVYRYVEQTKTRNPLSILNVQAGSLLYEGADPALADDISEAVAAADLTPAEFVALPHLPHVGRDEAEALFADDVPLERSYKPIKDGGVPYVQARLAIPNDTVSLHAGRVYETLLEFEVDIVAAWNQLEEK